MLLRIKLRLQHGAYVNLIHLPQDIFHYLSGELVENVKTVDKTLAFHDTVEAKNYSHSCLKLSELISVAMKVIDGICVTIISFQL